MPSSIAVRTIRTASASSTSFLPRWAPPTPRQETCSPVEPSGRIGTAVIECDRLGPSDAELIDAAHALAMHAEHLCNLNRIEAERRRSTGGRWGCSGKREGVMHRGREGDRSSPPANVEIDEVRRFACQVIVKRGLLD